MATTIPARFSDTARFILHPTDFSPASELAFAHALRLALTNKGCLTLLHVGDGAEEDGEFPRVREVLQRWGLLDPGARRADVFNTLGIEVKKVLIRNASVAAAIAEYCGTHQVDMLVVATEQRGGLARWLRPSTAERVARTVAVPTLFVPADGGGCVSLRDGQVTLDRVLVPVDHSPPVGGAVERGLRALAAYGKSEAKLTLLHVGPESGFPSVTIPNGQLHVDRVAREGDPVTEILAAAQASTANLVIMVTKGTDGFLDALRGTTTEQVIRQAPCPVLAVPADE